MPGESIILDPLTEDATNVQLDIVDNASYFLLAHTYDPPDQDAQYASSADTEGELPTNARPRNRTLTAQLRVVGTSAADLEQKLGFLEQKVGKFQREGGTWKRTTPAGLTIVFDVLNEASGGVTFDKKYVSRQRAVVDLKVVAKPYGRGPAFASFTDTFAADTLGNYTADAGAVGNVAVAGGVLDAVANLTTENQLVLTSGQSYTSFYDVQATVKVTLGTTLSGFKAGVILKRISAGNCIVAYVDDTGAASRLRIDKVVAGVATNLVSQALTRMVVSTSYWVTGRIEGPTVYAEFRTAAPTATVAPTTSTSWTLAGGDATTFGVAVAGKVGLDFTPQQTAASLDDFVVDPNVWVDRTLPAVTGVAYGVGGDVEALGKLTVTNTDPAAADLWWVMWGIQSRYFSTGGAAVLFWEAEALTAQGGSAVATQASASPAGSASNNVMRNTGVTTTYQSILSTQATGGGSHMSHVGDFQVLARVYDSSASTGVVTCRLDWSVGDFRQHTLNAEVQAPAVGAFSIVDLGQIHIPKAVVGTQRWEGRVLAKATSAGQTFAVDCLYLVPITEGSGRASAVQQYENVTSFSARDEFNQTSGALTGKTLPVGGTWAGAGDADDFTLDGLSPPLRNAVNDTTLTGRFAIAGTATFTNVLVQVDGNLSAPAALSKWGVFARYVDTNNYIRAYERPYDASGRATVAVDVVIAGVLASTSVLTSTVIPASTYYTVRLAVDAAGRFAAWLFPQGRVPSAPVVTGQHAALATGGSLATGKAGFFDEQNSATANVRSYDNFVVAVPNADAAVYTGRTLEVRNDRAIRQDSAGTYYMPPSKYEGNYLFVPPAGREGRAARVTVLKSRNDPATMADAAIDDGQVQLTYTPRYLEVPE